MLTVIIVTAIFYIPFHVGPPVLLSLLYGKDAAQRRAYAQKILMESVITMIISLTAFFLLWETELGIALGVMLTMMIVPYFRVWGYRRAALGGKE